MPTTRPSRPVSPSRRKRDRRGAAAVEFALVMLPLITLLLGTIQFGFYFFTSQSASSAARETARRLVVGDCRASGEAQNFAAGQANVSNLTLTYGTPGAGRYDVNEGAVPAIGQTLRVRVQADGDIMHFIPMPDGGRVTRVVNARVEDDTVSASC
jgi:Flp pilus assembly protein TadG